MGYNKFLLSVVFQVVLIGATSFLIVWSFHQEHLVVARFTFSVLWLIELAYLIYFVTRSNRRLQIFLESLKASDYMRSDRSSKSAETLNAAYNTIIDEVRSTRMEKMHQKHYLKLVLESVPVGVVTFHVHSGKIDLYNNTARNILNRDYLADIGEFDSIQNGLTRQILQLKPSGSLTIMLDNSFQEQKILFRASEFILSGEQVKLLSLQNIKHQLEEEELQAWQKLISVLRHEVMNSVGPVRSLTKTLLRMFQKNDKTKSTSEISDQTLSDAVMGLQSIENRADGMIRFVDSYRELTKVPKPTKEYISAKGILNQVKALMDTELRVSSVNIIIENQKDEVKIFGDEKQIVQVLINLVKNATEAFHEEQKNKAVWLTVFHNPHDRACISVIDNGPGIDEDVKQHIFIPFFTTKTGGSGIGLNLARQIMYLHGGKLLMKSEKGTGSTFTLEF
jgi:nitrogen fixation/metabolism regulation signal transduction histidine kinase